MAQQSFNQKLCREEVQNNIEEAYNRSWADLTPDLLDLVVRKFRSIEDFVSFRACCTSWCSAAPLQNFNSRHQVPLLFQPRRLSIVNQKTQFSNPLVQPEKIGSIIHKLPDNTDSYCLGLRGWVLSVEKSSFNKVLCLCHAFSQIKIQLPPLISTWAYFGKAALSSDPLLKPLECTLVIILLNSSRILVWRPGDQCFGVIDTRVISNYTDILYFNGFFYTITAKRDVWKFDITNRTASQINFNVLEWFRWYFSPIVESAGALFMINKTSRGRYDDLGKEFRVYKISFESNECIEVNDLGDKAIFISINTSFSVDCSEVPECKRNCVYYITRDATSRCPQSLDMGIYNLKDGIVQRSRHDLSANCCPPMWMIPVLI